MPSATKVCLLKLKQLIDQGLNVHWIRFVLKNEKGEPMPDVEVKVVLPDKKIELARSDSEGLIHIKHLPAAGNCTLSLLPETHTLSDAMLIK